MTALLEAPTAPGGAHESSVTAYADHLALLSVMLGYPDDSLCALRTSVVEAVESLRPSSMKNGMLDFGVWWLETSPQMLRRIYVETFDTRRGCALYVTYLDHGDSRSRGAALYDIKQLYRFYGFEPTDEELPDYLPTVCQFAALAPAPGAQAAMGAAKTGVVGIRQGLVRNHSPYAPLLAAIETIIEKGIRP
ncbi:MAG: nitrate reductase molybdenum cofactor assembly chaperone [Propionibacteriaceae bacterium]|nr:nitrate reductase molybdenum cofactor assembly chaperone [Propionibacteriaceae bacterium]